MTVTNPSSALEMVRGMRSPASSTRRMMNCPALALAATRGAYTEIWLISGVSTRLSAISYFFTCFFSSSVAGPQSGPAV